METIVSGIELEEHKPFLEWMLNFLKPHLQGPQRNPFKILEVGCGNGLFAQLLLQSVNKLPDRQNELQVVAIDPSNVAIQLAKNRGLNAICVDFLKMDVENSDRYDIVLFTKSLHHIFPLDEAVKKAKTLIQPGGFLIAEEFARDAVNTATCRWLYDTLDLLTISGVFQYPPQQSHHHHHESNENSNHSSHHYENLVQHNGNQHHHHQHQHHQHQQHNHEHHHHHHQESTNTEESSTSVIPFESIADPLERWNRSLNHSPPLPGKSSLVTAVETVFGPNATTIIDGRPFFYHYLQRGLLRRNQEEGKRALELARKFAEQEKNRIANGEITPIGMIIVATA